MGIKKEALRDAEEYARAEMFSGEGAGIRRRHIQATVESKAHKDPTYAREFYVALAQQDMAEHARKARAERKRIDRSEALSKNIHGILNGDSKKVNASVLVIAAVAYVAHQTGYDRRAYEDVKRRWTSFKNKRHAKRMVRKWTDGNVTHIR